MKATQPAKETQSPVKATQPTTKVVESTSAKETQFPVKATQPTTKPTETNVSTKGTKSTLVTQKQSPPDPTAVSPKVKQTNQPVIFDANPASSSKNNVVPKTTSPLPDRNSTTLTELKSPERALSPGPTSESISPRGPERNSASVGTLRIGSSSPRSLQKMETKITVSVQKCDRCDDENATKFCVECDAPLCAQCSTDLHLKGKWVAHTQRELNL